MYGLAIIKGTGVYGDEPVLNYLASMAGWLDFATEGRMNVEVPPAANVNGTTQILLRAREPVEVGPFTGATYTL